MARAVPGGQPPPADGPEGRLRALGRAVIHLIGKSVLAYGGVVADDDDELFKALADPTRRIVLDELAERDGQSLFEICARLATRHQLAISRQGVSQHLAVLEAADLIRVRREGRYKFHDLNTEPLRRVVTRWLGPDTPPQTSESTP